MGNKYKTNPSCLFLVMITVVSMMCLSFWQGNYSLGIVGLIILIILGVTHYE